jgi:hypothetical protein
MKKLKINDIYTDNNHSVGSIKQDNGLEVFKVYTQNANIFFNTYKTKLLECVVQMTLNKSNKCSNGN